MLDSIEGIITALDEKNFGGIDKKAILRSISAAAGGGFPELSIDLLRKHDAPNLEAAVSDTKSAYMRAADFMSTELHIPSDSQLPYVNQVVVLSEVFRLVPNPDVAQRSEIKTWFWRTAISGYFGGWNTGNMAADLEAVQAFAKGAARIENGVLQPSAATWSCNSFAPMRLNQRF